MNAILCTAALLVLAQPSPNYKDRERHPLAPSLPRLTKEEERKIEATIDRMIQADIGKLKGADAKKALDEFNRLGPESSFNLIDGLNRTANMESSCPAVIIAKRLASIFSTTEDIELLTFAKENIGAGVTAKRHLNVLKDLQFNIQLRKGYLQRKALAQGKKDGGKTPAPTTMSPGELEKALAKVKGDELKALIQKQAPELLKGLLTNPRRDVKIATAHIVGQKKLRHGAELIALLEDGDDNVRQAGRQALVQLSGGIDHGPSPDASFTERETAVERWRAWWKKQK